MTPTYDYRCPHCGTGRWHAQACPEGTPDGMYDEADRQPHLAQVTAALLAQAAALTQVQQETPDA